MFNEVFTEGDSLLHKFDPRFKIVIAAVFTLVLALSSRWCALFAGLLFSLSILVMGKLPVKGICIRLVMVNGLILFLWLLLPFSVRGEAVFSLGPLTATREGVRYATLLTVRSNIIILALIGLLSTTTVFNLGRAMVDLKVPRKMVQLFFFTYRYLHVIQLEYERLTNALKIRGFQPKTSMHTYKTYAYLVGMLLVKSYDRSERVRKAMICRGFKGRFYNLTEFHLGYRDLLLVSLMLLGVAAIGLLQWTRIIY